MRILARKPRLALCGAGSFVFAGVSLAQPSAPLPGLEVALSHRMDSGADSDLSVMTYNVKGLPWPIATGRTEALERIGERLAWMRSRGVQPSVIVLQEAFTEEAKAIGDQAGYAYLVFGADAPPRKLDAAADRSWMLGETQGKQIDSGLMLLSDFPITEVRRAAFPEDACAGYDCLAAKGVLLVRLAMPGGSQVAVATTHLNSKGASKASPEATTRAYRAQVEFMAAFLRDNWDRRDPLILAGDFNLGDRPERRAILIPAFSALNGGGAPREALAGLVKASAVPPDASSDAAWIVARARDMQYLFAGAKGRVAYVSAQVPFGSEASGAPLSDHYGYTVEYRFASGAS